MKELTKLTKYGDYSSEIIELVQDFVAGGFSQKSLATLYELDLISSKDRHASLTEEGQRLLQICDNRKLD